MAINIFGGFENFEQDSFGAGDNTQAKSELKIALSAIGTLFFNPIPTPNSEPNSPKPSFPQINWGTFEKATESSFGFLNKTGSVVNKPVGETKSAVTSLFKDYILPKKEKQESPEEQEKKFKEANRKRTFFEALKRFRINKPRMVNVGGKPMSASEVNARYKVLSGYEGIMNDQGVVYAHVAAAIEIENSKMEAEQLKKSKEAKLAQATKGKAGLMREGELLMGGENKQHFTNVAG